MLVTTHRRGSSSGPAKPAGSAATADPWAGNGAADPTRPRQLPTDPAAFLKLRPAGPPVVVTGLVTLAPGGTPVAGAEVAFMNETGENTAIADAAGRYSIKVASGVRWKVHARSDQAVGYPETFVPSSTDAVRDLEIHPTARVRGHVRDARGAVVGGAVVSIEVDPANRGLLESALPMSTTTDDGGAYELAALPGAILVKGARGMQQGVGAAATLAPGETAEVDVALRDAIAVNGHVVHADGSPVPGAKIRAATTISPGGPTEKLELDADGAGAFALTMPAGWVRLEARSGGDRSPTSAQWVDSGGRLDDVTITIAAPVAMRGKIVTADGTPVGGASVRLSANATYDGVSHPDGTFAIDAPEGQAFLVKIKHSDGSVTRQVPAWNGEETFVLHSFGAIELAMLNDPPIAGDVTVTVTSFLPDGESVARAPAESSFRGAGKQIHLANLEPGRYDLTVAAKGYAAATLPRVLVKDGGSRPVPVRLDAPALVRGTVKSNNQPIAGAQVAVAGKLAFTDARGRWSIADVAPGPIAIAVTKQGFGNAWVSATAGAQAGPVEIDLRPAGDGAGVVDGVGVVLSPGADGAVVASVLPGSPADGKLAAGDRIAEIDGTEVGAAAVDEIVARLRGSAGSSVSITVQRGADASKVDVDVVRRRLVVPQGTPAVAIAAERVQVPGGRRC